MDIIDSELNNIVQYGQRGDTATVPKKILLFNRCDIYTVLSHDNIARCQLTIACIY